MWLSGKMDRQTNQGKDTLIVEKLAGIDPKFKLAQIFKIITNIGL